jgi:LEA14-like dessication related protein
MRFRAIFLVLLILTGTHFSFSAVTKDLKMELKEKRIRDFSLDGLTLVFYVSIQNSSSRTYYLSGYEYRFIVDQKDYLQLQTNLEEGLMIEKRQEILVAFPVKITYKNLFRTIPEMKEKLHVMCNLVGWARFSDGKRERGKLALAFTGDFPIFRTPELELVQLKVNTLTVGGAELDFKAKVKNKNRFDLIVDRIAYTLTIAGYKIDQGTIPGDKNIDKQGEKIFSLPLLLNFFDVGREVHDVLDKASAQCVFSGEVEGQTVWGRLIIPFDEQVLMAISRIP